MNDYCEGRHTDCYRLDCGCPHHDGLRAKAHPPTELKWAELLARVDALVATVGHETR